MIGGRPAEMQWNRQSRERKKRVVIDSPNKGDRLQGGLAEVSAVDGRFKNVRKEACWHPARVGDQS
jgi:hypothetical protein